ncbi:hypothetical protein Tco_0244957 [Tanacetum coccineum]
MDHTIDVSSTPTLRIHKNHPQSQIIGKSTAGVLIVNTASASRTFSPIGPASGLSFVPFGGSFPIDVANLPHDPLMPELEDTAKIRSTGIFGDAYDDHDLETLNTPYADQSMGAEANFNNMEPSQLLSVLFPQLEYTLFILKLRLSGIQSQQYK